MDYQYKTRTTMIISNKLMKLALILMLVFVNSAAYATKGIYLTQYSVENTAFIKNVIQHAKASGIDTFVIDMEISSKQLAANIGLIKEAGIKYVARIIMFPGGAKPGELMNQAIWEKKYALVQRAIEYGAAEIQLDYIRYSAKQKASPQNAQDVLAVITWFNQKLQPQKIPLQIDVFGIASFGESKYIGQNIKTFSNSVDAICPMVYPSHYSPYAYHSARPYGTILDSLQRVKKQFGGQMPIKLIPYIEMTNFHYLGMSHVKKIAYIKAQIRATHDAGADGWYAWSAHNRYDNLFAILEADPANDSKAVADESYTEPKFGNKILVEDKPQNSNKSLAEEDRHVAKPEEPKKSEGFSWFRYRHSF